MKKEEAGMAELAWTTSMKRSWMTSWMHVGVADGGRRTNAVADGDDAAWAE
jgi:hypothetical protein